MEMGAWGIEKSHSEYDIVYLHKTFLTAGLHVLPRAVLDDDHRLIEIFLASVSRNAAFAFLGTNVIRWPKDVFLLFEEFRSNAFAYEAIDSFLLIEFYYQFCWIEYTDELARCSWFKHFCKRLYDFNLLHAASVVFFV